VVAGHQGSKALRAAAEIFELTDQQLNRKTPHTGANEPAVRGVAMDLDQAQVSVKRLPDRPGSAAAVCKALADASISVDAIVQSERSHTSNSTTNEGASRDMSFILHKVDLARAEQALKTLLKQWPGTSFEEGSAIARISAVGAGMPYTAGTAAKMFRALADAAINIELIATSEIRTSCVVPEEQAVAALNAVHTAFGLGGAVVNRAEGSEFIQA